MSQSRTVLRVEAAHRQLEGGGFLVRRPFPAGELPLVDPFLLLDEMGPSDYAPGEAVGAPEHPHRGFETVTYLLEGEMEHQDSAGHRGLLGPGDVQWMTAGAGVVHSEMPSRRMVEEGGRVHGFQLWVNLPRKDKRLPPRYQEFPASHLPDGRSTDGLARVKVIAGSALGVSAVIETRTPIVYQDWTLLPGASVEIPLAASHRGFVYVFGGEARVGVSGTRVPDGSCALLGEGDSLELGVPDSVSEPARLLLCAGAPLNEPVARYGPFVMNTREEIDEAIADYRAGRMGELGR
jgi:quercetin 2,3-dioxygenase